MTTRERLERKAERRREWATKAGARSAAKFGAADGLSQGFAGGQPILVGHHSEGRARRDQAAIHSAGFAGLELSRQAELHAQKAEGIVRQLDGAVYSDDPDAVARLEARIADRVAELAAAKAAKAPSYLRTNLAASLRRDRQRLAALTTTKEKPDE